MSDVSLPSKDGEFESDPATFDFRANRGLRSDSWGNRARNSSHDVRYLRTM
jgi:hypothetical protein